MANTEQLNRLLAAHERRLRVLELDAAKRGAESPPGLLKEIEDVRAEIARLQAELAGPDEGQPPLPSLKTADQAIPDGLARLGRKVQKLAGDLPAIAEPARGKASDLLARARRQLDGLAEGWARVKELAEPPQPELDEIKGALFEVERALKVLELRRIHQNNLNLLREQVSRQGLDLYPEQLEKVLRPAITAEQAAIEALERQDAPGESKQKQLAIRRRNLALYQAMLAGERPYVPVQLLNQVVDTEEALRKIDEELAGAAA